MLNIIEIEVLDTQAVVITPTREIALQIKEIVDTMGIHMEVRTLNMIGGTSLADTRTAMQSGCNVVVGTPGRVHDMILTQQKDFCDG